MDGEGGVCTVIVMRKFVGYLSAYVAAAGLAATLVVVGGMPAVGLDGAFARCLDRPSDKLRYECAKTLIESSYPARTAEEVNEAIMAATQEGGVKGLELCHKFTEYLGTYQARIQGVAALDELVYSCLGGPVHGVFYTLGLEHRAEEIAAMSVGVCEMFGAGKPWVVGWDCRHGVGHAIAEDATVDAAELPQFCDRVYAGAAEREDCASGLIGGLIERLGKEEQIAGLPGDPVRWCATLTSPYDRACKQRSGLLAAAVGVADPDLPGVCAAGDINCSYGVGFYFGQAVFPLSPRERVGACGGFAPPDRRACIAGVVRAITPDYWLDRVDPGVCAFSGADAAFCRSEQEQMRRRELTIGQIRGVEPYETITGDTGAWPAELRPGR